MTKPDLRNRVRAGETVIGLLTGSRDADQAELASVLGWEFVMFDAEHGAFTPGDVSDLARAVQAGGGVPLVRTPGRDRHVISRFLESGVQGVMAPFIDDAEAAAAFVNASLYPPQGQRGVAATRATAFGHAGGLAMAMSRVNEGLLVIAQIETPEAVAAASEICAQPRVDVVFLGLADLSAGLGHPMQMQHSDVQFAAATVAQAVSASGRRLGALVSSPKQLAGAFELGATFIAVHADAVWGLGAKAFLCAMAELSTSRSAAELRAP